MTSSTRRAQELFSLADSQAGYFTAAQASVLGYGYPLHHHHLRQGNWQRVRHGLFRLTTYPITPHEQLAELSLWSRNRQGEPQAVMSHDTALAFHGVSDLLPERLHLTVPPGFRKAPPEGVVLHRSKLSAEDLQTEHGFQVTTVLRTLEDLLASGNVTDVLEQALTQAAQTGAISSVQARTLRKVVDQRR